MIHQEQWQQLVAMIARHAQQDGRTASAIDFLSFGRSSHPPSLAHIASWAGFALMAQGQKALRMGDDVMHYGPGDLLLVTMDMPVQSCVVLATPFVGREGSVYLIAGILLAIGVVLWFVNRAFVGKPGELDAEALARAE